MSNQQGDLWHYAVGGQKMGPVAFAVLNEMVRHGDLPRDCMVWQAGMPQWVRLDQMPQFGPALGQAPAVPPPPVYSIPRQDNSGKATASLVLGLIGLLAWLLPIVGLPVTIVGVVMGAKGRNSSNRGVAVAGLVLSIIGLILTVINAAIGAYLGATGQLRF